jgi:hypothetical protein
MGPIEERNREIGHHILTGSTTMIGVCITVIALFRVMNTSLKTYADELLAFDNIVFIVAALFAYSSIRKDNNKKLERIADVSFLFGMLLILVAAIMIVFSS